jgi:NDP-sugar pyrophosphorylase family protein
MKPTLIVLAAGMGSRYGGLKQMDPVGPSGETIIDYSIHDAVQAGFGKVVFVIRPDFAELFKKELGSRFEKKIEVAYAYQELSKLPEGFSVPAGREKPWGTGQALLMAEGVVDGPFAMVNADDFYGAESFRVMGSYLMQARDKALADYSMVGYRLRATLSEHGTVSRGVCLLNADGSLKAVDERTKIEKLPQGAKDQLSGALFSGDEIVSMNFFGFTPSVFAHLRRLFAAFLEAEGAELKSEFFVPKIVDKLIQGGLASVQVLPTAGPWFGVTYREDKPLVQAGIKKLVDAGLYPPDLRA